MRCPDEHEVAGFVRGELSASDADAFERHLDSCAACASVVAAFVQVFDEGSGGGEHPTPLALPSTADGAGWGEHRMLTPGAAVGRYRVLEVVGIGGMGVVYAAYDPELDRKIALKLLRRAEQGGAERRQRLVREAQAMARLSHPNVITVHDVGTHDDQVFVAMEFVQGQTLSRWLTSDHPWTAIQTVFVAAGRGLEAAHEAGIVHRDFKPDNVLIGDDGRVRVTDFGLARLDETDTTVPSSPLSDEADVPPERLTVTGTLMGTPAYMAPEQFEDSAATPASDQYSFCIALYEAVYGEPPHKAKSLPQLVARVLETKVEKPDAECKAPGHARDAILRGLSRGPEDRFETMGVLLAELAPRPTSRWRPAIIVAVPALAVAVGVAAYDPKVSDPAACARDAFDGIWDEVTKQRVAAAFAETELAYADESWAKLEVGLDRYTEQWLDLEEQACTVRRDDSTELMSTLQSMCLVEPREAVTAAIAILEQADAAVVEKALYLQQQLPSLEHCQDREALMGKRLEPAPVDIRDQVGDGRRELAKVKALITAGKYDDALARAEAASAVAGSLDYAPYQAEAQYTLGVALRAAGREKDADDAYHQAAISSTASGHHEVAARSWLRLVSRLIDGDRYDEALRFVGIAQATTSAWGQDRGLVVEALSKEGTIHRRAGRYDRAIAIYRRTEAIYAETGESLRRADQLEYMGRCEMELRQLDSGLAHLEESLKLRREALGADHPDVADAYLSISTIFHARGDLQRAREYLESAREIMGRSVKPEHPSYVSIEAQLGQILSFLGEHDRAIEMLEHAIAAELAGSGVDNAREAIAVATLAQAYFNAQRFADAVEQATISVEALEQLYPEGHVREVVPRLILGLALLEVGKVGEASTQAARGLKVCRRLCPGRDPNLISLYELEGRVLTQRGERRRAVEVLAEGLTAAAEIGSLWEAWIGFRWAEAVWPDRSQRKRALELAGQASKVMHEAGDARVEHVDAWLEQHAPNK